MRRLTLSRAPIAIHCVAFLRDGAVWHDPGTTYAKVGHATHACNEFITNGEIPDLAAIAKDEGLTDDEAGRLRDLVQRWATWAAEQNREGWMCEVKLAYNLNEDAGRVLAAKAPRDYSEAHEGDIAGSADLVYVRGPGAMWKAGERMPGGTVATSDSPRMVVVCDYKSGFGRSVTPIKRNMQLRGLALAAARAYGVDDALVSIVHIPDDRPVWEEWDYLNFFKLGAVAAQLGEIMVRAEGDEEKKPGPWCRYCPAKFACEATAEAIADVIPPEALAQHHVSLAITNDDHAKWSLAIAELLLHAAKQIKESVKAHVTNNGALHLDDGTIFQGWPSSVRAIVLEHPATKRLLEREGVADLVEESVALGKINRKLGKKRADALFDEMKKVGALVSNERNPTFEARNAKGEAA